MDVSGKCNWKVTVVTHSPFPSVEKMKFQQDTTEDMPHERLYCGLDIQYLWMEGRGREGEREGERERESPLVQNLTLPTLKVLIKYPEGMTI